ncbi:sensor histidine kinase [Galbibacter orientalis]|uniref:sensor histidine kinase n=1 Tax=Galbibacter orientalis TaxID=453852 RepID=UPI0030809D44
MFILLGGYLFSFTYKCKQRLKRTLCFLLVLSTIFCFAQEKVQQTATDKDRFQTLQENLEQVVSKIKSDSYTNSPAAIKSLRDFLIVSKKNKDWKSAIIILNYLANYDIYYEMNHKTIYDSLQLFEQNISKITDIQEVAKYYIAYAEAATYLEKYETSLQIIDKALTVLEPKKDSVIEKYAYLYLKAGENSSKVNNLIKSVTYFKRASEIFLKQKDTISFLWSQNGLSRLLGNNGLFDEAAEARNPIFLWKNKISEVEVVVMAHITAAIEATSQNAIDKELYHTRQALLLADQMASESKQVIEILMRACATYIFARHNLLKESDAHLKKLKGLMEHEQRNAFLNTYYTLAIGQNTYAHGNYKRSVAYLLDVFETVKQAREPENILAYEFLLAQNYEEIGNINKSLSHFKNYMTLKDSIQKSTSRKRFAYVQNKFELQKKDLEIAEQKQYISLLGAKNKLKSQWILIGGISLISIFLVIYLLRSRAFQKRNQKLQKEFYENLFFSIEKERKDIASNLHDSIGQNLLVIKNKFLLKDQNEDVSVVDNTIKGIRDISQNLHPYKFEKIGLLASLKNTIKVLQQNTAIFFSEEINEEENLVSTIDIEKHLQIFRIIQEALNNVIKHSEAKACFLDIKADVNYINFFVKDNGKGFVVSKYKNLSNSLGMKTMRGRSAIINASLEITSTLNNGTLVHLKVPKHE